MKLYEGTKRMHAKPMTRGDYNRFRGWQQPADEDPADAGYLVEYVDGGKPNVEGFDGYVSWSPADVFERAYREIDPDNPPGRDTSHDVAGLASRLMQITPREISEIVADTESNRLPELVREIRSVAASALGQAI
jgi:hypothetical protein